MDGESNAPYNTDMYHFPRKALAKDLADALLGKKMFSSATQGLFLTAWRRTGKTTFLQHDLMPALTAAGVLAVYVDLWANQDADPGVQIAQAIGKALEGYASLVSRAMRRLRLHSVNLGGALTFDVSTVGAASGLSIPDALLLLIEASKKPVALIIDEAQHALTSKSGEATMAALKSARDQINKPGSVRLALVMSGSDRDKLMRLVNTAAAPFYGCQMTPMPALGDDFIDHIAKLITRQRPSLAPINTKLLSAAFELFNFRPEFLVAALDRALSPLSGSKGRFEKAVYDAATARRAEEECQMHADFSALKPLERAVLSRLLAMRDRFRPYDADALKFYGKAVGKPVIAPRVQVALEALRSRLPPLVWKSAHGDYALYDVGLQAWYDKLVEAKAWPPADPDA